MVPCMPVADHFEDAPLSYVYSYTMPGVDGYEVGTFIANCRFPENFTVEAFQNFSSTLISTVPVGGTPVPGKERGLA